MKLPAAGAIALALANSPALAGERADIVVSPTDTRTFKALPPEYFTGSARMGNSFQADDPGRTGGATVVFEPGARTHWHTHPAGQTLIVTDGTGWVQAWDGAVQEIRTGDVVSIPSGVKHWHGATPTQGMSHVAVAETVDGTAVTWMEPVTDDQYRR